MKVYIRTYGCQMNDRDSEDIAVQFIERGWELTDDENQADVCIVNTCSVREQAEQKAIGKLGRLVWNRKSIGTHTPVIGVTGCMAQNKGKDLVKLIPDLDFVAGSKQTHRIGELAISIFNDRKNGITHPELPPNGRRTFKTSIAQVDISDNEESHLHIKKHITNLGTKKACGFVSIMQGCQMNCSYCIVPKVRGAQRSRPTEDVIEEVKLLAQQGVREVTLLGQVVNAFGREKGKKDGITEFVRLLREINKIDGIARIRFTSPHPSYFGDDLIDAYASIPKLCEYVHLPMQSGSDRILKEMNRPYRADKFLEIVQKLREKKPNISISTDVIVGYPDETDEDFQKTRELFKASNFDMAFIFKYSPRMGTKSAELPDSISEEIKEERNQILLADLSKHSIAYHDALVGTTQEVLVEAPAKRGENLFMGRTRTHRKVIFPATPDKIATLVNVKITSATVTALEGFL
ncbi:MAG: tRNA (N6-isopentenyl adenosine(37)-C2)-methylthiotransferase MiaB [Opitutales bacterium]|nr:tRNA (N6-isopentenyl adenosine(37)-C2)-methylthiotransferase MiaB [Opitutales bacterium]